MQFKKKGYLPTGEIIKSGTVLKRAGRYYVSVLVDMPDDMQSTTDTTSGIGIGLGLKDFAVISDGTHNQNINKIPKIKKHKEN